MNRPWIHCSNTWKIILSITDLLKVRSSLLLVVSRLHVNEHGGTTQCRDITNLAPVAEHQDDTGARSCTASSQTARRKGMYFGLFNCKSLKFDHSLPTQGSFCKFTNGYRQRKKIQTYRGWGNPGCWRSGLGSMCDRVLFWLVVRGSNFCNHIERIPYAGLMKGGRMGVGKVIIQHMWVMPFSSDDNKLVVTIFQSSIA